MNRAIVVAGSGFLPAGSGQRFCTPLITLDQILSFDVGSKLAVCIGRADQHPLGRNREGQWHYRPFESQTVRQFPIANLERCALSAEFIPSFKGVYGIRPNLREWRSTKFGSLTGHPSLTERTSSGPVRLRECQRFQRVSRIAQRRNSAGDLLAGVAATERGVGVSP